MYLRNESLCCKQKLTQHCKSTVLLLLLLSRPVMSDSLQRHGLQHARSPCPSPYPKVCPSSCPLQWWCLPATSSSEALFSFPSIFPSIRDFSNESAVHIRWPKYWSFSFSISPSNEYSGLNSLKIDWFDLLTVQGTLWSLSQHHKYSHYLERKKY